MNGTIITVWLAIIMLPSLLLILSPLIDKILTEEVIEEINGIIDNVEYLIGSFNTTLLFWVITVIIVIPIIRRFFSFFWWNKNNY